MATRITAAPLLGLLSFALVAPSHAETPPPDLARPIPRVAANPRPTKGLVRNPSPQMNDPAPRQAEEVRLSARDVAAAESQAAGEAFHAPVPVIALVPKTPMTLKHGQPTTLEWLVRNNADRLIDEVVVAVSFGANVEVLSTEPSAGAGDGPIEWNIGALPPGATVTLKAKLVATASGEEKSLRLSSSVRFRGETFDDRRIAITRPNLELNVKGPSAGVVGEPASYVIEVSNVGDLPVEGVVLRDRLPDGLTHPQGPELENQIGALAPGQTRKVKLTVTPKTSGEFTHRVVVTADGAEDVNHELRLAVDAPKLILSGKSPKTRQLNRPCTVELQLVNQGKIPARDVKVTANLPEGITFAHASDDGKHDALQRTVHWTVPALAPGETKNLLLTGVASKAGDQIVQAALLAGDRPTAQASLSTKVEGVVALQVDVTDLDDPVATGSETTYEIRVINQGTMAATKVAIEVDAPESIEVLAAEGPSARRATGATLGFEPLPSLAAKADATYRLKVRARKPGDQRLRVTVKAEQLSRPLSIEESTTVFDEEP